MNVVENENFKKRATERERERKQRKQERQRERERERESLYSSCISREAYTQQGYLTDSSRVTGTIFNFF